jgi:hypothetical protein
VEDRGSFRGRREGRAREHLKAVVVVGSLGAGRYIPGRSDIDLIVVTDDECSDECRSAIKKLADDYWEKFGPRKGFGGYGVRESDLNSPTGSLREMAFEILQLKRQGQVILGEFDLAGITEPTYAYM